MSPAGHLLVAGTIGAAMYGTTGSWPGAVAALAAGVLPDVDHTLDYYNWLIRRRTHRVFYLFHGWEYLGLLVLAAALLDWNPLVLGLALGYASHAVGDYLVSDRHLLWYSLLFRAGRGFRRDNLQPKRRRFPPSGPGQPVVPPPQAWPKREILRWLLIHSFPPLRRFLWPPDPPR